jgi:WD40 repeat protein
LQVLRVQADKLAWSPDGTRIALGFYGKNNTGEVFQVWDAASGKQLSTFQDQPGAVCCLVWSPDGTRLATGGTYYSGGDPLRIWDAATGNKLLSLLSNSSSQFSDVLALTWLADGSRIVALIETGPAPTASNPTLSLTEEVRIWDAASGKLLSTSPTSIPGNNMAAWSPDGKEIAVGNDDGTIQVWGVTTGKRLLTYQGDTHAPLVLAWSPTGKAIASASGYPEVQVWDPATGTTFFHYHGHVGNVDALAWSPDGTRIVSGSQSAGGSVEEHPLQVWDAFTGQHPAFFGGQSEGITVLAWSPDGNRIASAGYTAVQILYAPPRS